MKVFFCYNYGKLFLSSVITMENFEERELIYWLETRRFFVCSYALVRVERFLVDDEVLGTKSLRGYKTIEFLVAWKAWVLIGVDVSFFLLKESIARKSLMWKLPVLLIYLLLVNFVHKDIFS